MWYALALLFFLLGYLCGNMYLYKSFGRGTLNGLKNVIKADYQVAAKMVLWHGMCGGDVMIGQSLSYCILRYS